MSFTSFMELAQVRFATRKFSDRAVEEEKLAAVLKAAQIAPTAKNQQPWRVYVIQSETMLSKLSELTHCAYGAKTVLLFTYKQGEVWQNPLEEGVHSGIEDVSIAATHAMLEATEQGLNTCWCNYFSNTKLEAALNLPADEKSVVLMPLGYAADEAKPAPMHVATKPLDELVKYL